MKKSEAKRLIDQIKGAAEVIDEQRKAYDISPAQDEYLLGHIQAYSFVITLIENMVVDNDDQE